MSTKINGGTGVDKVTPEIIADLTQSITDDVVTNVYREMPVFSAIRVGNQTIAASTNAVVIFNTINSFPSTFDSHTGFNTTGAYTVPISGYYQINASIDCTASAISLASFSVRRNSNFLQHLELFKLHLPAIQ